MIFRRKPFRELVERQLDLFATDEDELLSEAAEADAVWTNADASESEELYGDYQLVADAVGDRLLGLRETYATTLDDSTGDRYRSAFDRAARKRFGRYASIFDADS